MKLWLLNIIPAACGLMAAAGGGATHTTWLRWVLLLTSSFIIQFFFVQKYPKSQALKWAVKLRKGQIVKVEVEGK